MMRLDPQLCFLKICGPPDEDEINAAAAKPNKNNIDMDNDDSKLDEDEDSMLSGSKTPASERASSVKPSTKDESSSTNGQFKPFPSGSELNGRLRRLMASYQRENKREEARLAAQDRRNERRERIEQVIKEREQLTKQKLTRKEENDFFRAIMAYGIETKADDQKKILWDRFKQLARLDKKYDETLSEYYTAFTAACKKATGQSLNEEEESCQLQIDAIDEVKAKKIFARVDLMKTIRDTVLPDAKLDEKLLMCEDACDLPEWWVTGKHDKDLLQGVARSGMARMDYFIMSEELCFKDLLKRQLMNEPLLDKKMAKEYEKLREKAKLAIASKDENDEEKTVEEQKEEGGENGQKDKDEAAEDKEKPKASSGGKAKRARRASVTIAPPQITMQQMEQMAKGGLLYDMSMMNDLVAQTYAATFKWPKDQVLAIRIEQVVKCVEEGKFPEKAGYSLGEILAGLQDSDNTPFDPMSPDANLRETSTPLSESSMLSDKAKSTESKIHQLLTSSLTGASKLDEDDPLARYVAAKQVLMY